MRVHTGGPSFNFGRYMQGQSRLLLPISFQGRTIGTSLHIVHGLLLDMTTEERQMCQYGIIGSYTVTRNVRGDNYVKQ